MKKINKRICSIIIIFTLIVMFIPNNMVQASTTKGYTYNGYTGVSWIRDTTSGHSPLSLSECFSGTYCLEVDYLTYSSAFTVLTAKTKFNSIKSILETAGTTAAAELVIKIAKQLGFTIQGIAAAAVSVVIGYGYAALSQLDTASFNNACTGLKNYQMVKVVYQTANNMMVKCYSKYTPSNRTIRASGYNTYTISNPYSGKYGTWMPNKYGYLYRL